MNPVHFGIPLAKKHQDKFEDFETEVCGYQGFEEVQEIAANLNFM